MKPGEKTAKTADELVDDTETETETGGDDAANALEDELTAAVTDALSDDDEPGDSDDDDELDLEGEDLDGDLDEEEEEEEEETEPAAGAAADPAKPAETAAAADASATETAAQTEAPSWTPFAVTANKEQVPIEEAHVTRSGGNVFLAIPEKDFGRFQTRISRGVLFERVSRQLETERRELEARKTAPARKTDSEIEAEITLEAIKPFLGDLFDEKDLDLLKLRVKDAQRDAKESFDKTERERIEKANETPWEETQVRGLADQTINVWQSYPELKDKLSEDEMKAVYVEELLPVRNALYYRQGEDILANTQYIYDRLKVRAAKAPAGGAKPAIESSSTTATPAPNSAAKANPSSTASPKGKAPADKAERFNRAVDSSAPRTTNVKANRGTRPGKAATRGSDGRLRRRSEREEQVAAEDSWRNTERAYLSSTSLDFE